MTLQFIGKTLDSQEVKTCCGELEADSIKSLTLRECGLGSKSFRRLMTAIGHCKSLEYLNLNLCNINCRERINLLAAALTGNRRLLALHLHGNEMGPEGVSTIVTALKDHPRIINLDLGGTDMDDGGLKLVCNLLPPREKHPGLCELILSANPKITPRAWEKFAVAVSASSNLTNLQIDFNDIGESAGKMLVTAIAGHKTLQRLDVESCGLTDSVGRLFVYMVQHFPCSLTYILLEGNDFSERTKSSIRVSLGDSQSDQSSSDEDGSPAHGHRRRVTKTRGERDSVRRKPPDGSAGGAQATADTANDSGIIAPRKAASTKLPVPLPPTPPPPPPRSDCCPAGAPALVYCDANRIREKGRDRSTARKENLWRDAMGQADGCCEPANRPTPLHLASPVCPTYAPQSVATETMTAVAGRDVQQRFEKVLPLPFSGPCPALGDRGPAPTSSGRPPFGAHDHSTTYGHAASTAVAGPSTTIAAAHLHRTPPTSAPTGAPLPASAAAHKPFAACSVKKSASAGHGSVAAAAAAAAEHPTASEDESKHRNGEGLDVTYTFTPESPDADCSLRHRVEEDASGISRLRIMGECGGGRVQVRMRSVSPSSVSELRRPPPTHASATEAAHFTRPPSHLPHPPPSTTYQPALPYHMHSAHGGGRHSYDRTPSPAPLREQVYCSEKKARMRSRRSASGAAPYQVFDSDCDCDSDVADDDRDDWYDDEDDDWTAPPPPRSRRSGVQHKDRRQCVSHRGRWIGRSPQPAATGSADRLPQPPSKPQPTTAGAAVADRLPSRGERNEFERGIAAPAAAATEKRGGSGLLAPDSAAAPSRTQDSGKRAAAPEADNGGSDVTRRADKSGRSGRSGGRDVDDDDNAVAKSTKPSDKAAASNEGRSKKSKNESAAAEAEAERPAEEKRAPAAKLKKAPSDDDEYENSDRPARGGGTKSGRSRSGAATAEADDGKSQTEAGGRERSKQSSSHRETQQQQQQQQSRRTDANERSKTSAAATANTERNPERRSFLEAFKFCSSNASTNIAESIRKGQKVRIEMSDREVTDDVSPRKSKSRSTTRQAADSSVSQQGDGRRSGPRSSKSRERQRGS